MTTGDHASPRGHHRRTLALVHVAALALLATVGCAREKGEGQLAWLQNGLEKEFPDRDANAALELNGNPKVVQSPVVAGPPVTRPDPTLIALPAQTEGHATAPSDLSSDDPSTRPVIRIVGTGKARAAGHDDHIEMTLPDEHTGTPPSSTHALAPTASASKAEYDHALALVNAHDYDHALSALSAFLVKWPDDPGAEGALYWSGESYLSKGELVEAAEELEAVLTRFPHGAKVPDSLLELGVVSARLGNREKASAYFSRLTNEFPRSEAARRVPKDFVAPSTSTKLSSP